MINQTLAFPGGKEKYATSHDLLIKIRLERRQTRLAGR